MTKVRVAEWKDLEPLHPAYALVANVDLVVIRWQDEEQASLMQVMARACGHSHLSLFSVDDLTTWQREMAHLTGIPYGGVSLD
jgi:hypothetical protein